MNKSVELSDFAKADIKDISSYTRRKYGKQQVKIYGDKLYRHLEMLSQSPYVGHTRPDIPDGYKAKNAEKHVIVYTERDRVIYVARILHANADFASKAIQ